MQKACQHSKNLAYGSLCSFSKPSWTMLRLQDVGVMFVFEAKAAMSKGRVHGRGMGSGAWAEERRSGRDVGHRSTSILRWSKTQIFVGPSLKTDILSQRSLQNAPIFRLLLKVAVNGTHQCDCPNFCGADAPIMLCKRLHGMPLNQLLHTNYVQTCKLQISAGLRRTLGLLCRDKYTCMDNAHCAECFCILHFFFLLSSATWGLRCSMHRWSTIPQIALF